MGTVGHPFWHYILVVFLTIVKGLISEIVWFLVGLGGYFIFVSKKSPYDIVLGLPLLLIGIGFVVNSLWNEVLSVFSPTYNKGICFLCRRVEKSERKDKDGKVVHLEGNSEEVRY
jgi:hypothetical protein